MKKIFLFAAASVFCLNLVAQQTKSSQATSTKKDVLKTPANDAKTASATTVQATDGPTPDDVMKVNADSHDFGKIKQGVPVIFYFELKNVSKKPLVVENTYASCGCTTPDKIVEPIAPGSTAKLKVQYSAAAMGPFNKDVHIKLAGITQEKLVHITGEVIAEPAAEVKPNN